jgi:hypothetical protein
VRKLNVTLAAVVGAIVLALVTAQLLQSDDDPEGGRSGGSLIVLATPTPTPAPDVFVLHIAEPTESEVVTEDPSLLVWGRTRVDAALSINDDFVPVDADGTFALRMDLELGTNIMEVIASIASGEERSEVLAVIYAP